MSRDQYRIIALCIAVLSAAGAFILLPDQLEQFGDPKLVRSIVGGVMLVLTVISNWLPPIGGKTAGEGR